MQNLRHTILLFAWLAAYTASAQDSRIMFQNGAQVPEANLQSFISDGAPAPAEVFNNYYYRFIQFNNIPEEKNSIEQSGIILLQYMPHKAYVAAIPVNYDRSKLNGLNVRSVIPVEALNKLNKKLLEGVPAYAQPSKGMAVLRVQYMHNIEPVAARAAATAFGDVTDEFPANHLLTLRISEEKIFTLAQQPWVYYVDAAAPPSTPDDTKGRSLHRSNVISADYAMGRHYNGSGVAAALADDGLVGPHIDFTGRITNHVASPGGDHGDMTSGILAGSGNLDPVIRGMADGVQLHVFDIGSYPQIVDAVANNVSYGTVVSSTSYSQGCNEYTTDSQFGDQTIHDNLQLEFVFSAGNNQGGNCSYGAGAGWGVITGGYKQGKNVITVANLDEVEVLDPTSSRGPASDGRIKPDISSNGRNQLSTDEGNTYQVGGGTSAACPGIAGICTQLIQAYKELNSAPDAPTALIKACLLNSAEDIGNPGPDYTYGYGRVNSLRAVQTLEDNRYLSATISQSGTNIHTINVPAGTLQLRVMIYWHDEGGNPLATTYLINDLDMTVTNPSSVIFNPWILDPTANVVNLTAPATRNPDHLNNIEQVTIDNPSAGSYSVSVNGFAVPQGPQQYYLVYEFRTNAITVTYPIGGEGFVPLEDEIIRWDAAKGLGTFTLEYSIDNGGTWLNIASGINQSTLQYIWTVANNLTGQARIRVSRGAVSGMSAEKFSIIGTPAALTVSWACPDSIRLVWNPVPGAAWYEISRLGTYYMDSIATSATNSFIHYPVNGNLAYWYGCRAVFANGSKGRRCISIYKNPGLFACPFAVDAGITNVNSPNASTLQGCQNLGITIVSVTIKNNGATPLSNVPVRY
ncbi:MAG TPA: S8 family serine peptidase, partial [Bacteroidia bacterium]|nr:S8 family serine peptidase [Bacteroidia bacterium]